MKSVTSGTSLLAALLFVMLPGTLTWAQTDVDQARADTVVKQIDTEAASKSAGAHLDVLSKEFNVSSKVVEDLRAKQGWGGTTIELAMAQHLTQSDPKTYPTMTAALAKIGTLRAEKEGWGKIAKDLGFKLGPVVSAAEHARVDLARDLHQDRVQNVEKGERAERPDHSQRPERPERMHR